MTQNNEMINRREFLKKSAIVTTALTIGTSNKPGFADNKSGNPRKKVIIIGIDGMDPILSERLMSEGKLSTFSKLAESGGYRRLGTSTPPQSPVAWANFINGAGPGSHGIFDFIH
ncbi:MAG: alkaline phosphatase family protein, partial [Planctomycetota bacterium]